MKKKLGVAFLSLIIVGVFAIGFIAPQAKAATTAELQAQIQSLLAQVQQLQTLLSQQGGQVTWCHNFNSNLKIGDTNQEVTALQTALQKEGLLTKISGEFDENTASAVTGFQEKYASEILTSWGLKYGTGFVGASTRAKLNKLHGCVVIPPVCAQSCPLLTPTMLTCAFGYKQVCETLKPNTCGCYPPPSCKCVPISENQPPVISGVSGPTALKIGETGTWTVQASDPEQGVLTYSVVWGDEGVYAISTVAPQSLTYTQTATFTHSYREAVGVYNPVFTVIDNGGLSAKTSVSVNVGGVIVPTITSITPSQGTSNTTVNIYGANLTSATEVHLYNGTTLVGSIGNVSVSSSGSLLQFVLSGLVVENLMPGLYKISVVTPSGETNALPFTITAPSTIPSITVLSPNGGEKYSIGQTVPISISTNIPEKQTPGITLQLYRGMPGALGSSFVQTIISNWAGGPSYSWTIPTNLAAGQYTIYASALVPGMNLKEGGVSDSSDATFSIVSASSTPSITVLSPNGGESWQVGSLQTIKWNPVGGYKYVLVDLVRGTNNAFVKSISVGNSMLTGQFTWQIPSDIPTGSDYKIYINASNAVGVYGVVSDLSDAPFTIVATTSAIPSIIVLSPNGGEIWGTGKTYTITWDKDKLPIDINWRIFIDLMEYKTSNNAVQHDIFTELSNTGSVSWTIPNTFNPSNYRILVMAVKPGEYNATYSDTSDATFNIVAVTTTPTISSASFISPDEIILVNGTNLSKVIKLQYTNPNINYGNPVELSGSKLKSVSATAAVFFIDLGISNVSGNYKIKVINSEGNGSNEVSLYIPVLGPVNPVSCNPGQKVGDVNGDGKVDATDANLALSISVNTTKAPSNLCCVDLNKDGVVNISDVILIQRIANGLDKSVATCLINNLGLQEAQNKLANISAAVAELAQRIKEFLGR